MNYSYSPNITLLVNYLSNHKILLHNLPSLISTYIGIL